MEWVYIFRYFYLLGAANALFFSILVFSKTHVKLTDKLLGFWLIVLSLQLLAPFLYLSDINTYYHYAGSEMILYPVHPLLLYLYIKAMTGLFPSRNRLLLLILTGIIVEFSVLSYFMIPAQERLNLLLGKTLIKNIYFLLFSPILFYFIFYFIESYKSLKEFKTKIIQIYSYKENVDLLWLRRLLLLFYGLLISSLPLSIIFYFTDIPIAFGDYFYFAGLTFFIFLLGYWGYKQGQVFNFQTVTNQNKTNNNHLNNQKNSKELISQKALEMKELIEKDKPYLNPKLTIFELSKLVGMQPHQLSKLINKEFNCNFFEYINRYRIDEFKKYLFSNTTKDYTLLAIAFECGFNSKSAFNRIFKDQTGITPVEFKKQAQNIVPINQD